MQKHFSKKHYYFYLSILLVMLLVGSFSILSVFKNSGTSERLALTPSSSEINIAESSPTGSDGGLVVPASCPSDLHDDPTYGTACSRCNICGTCNNGTFQCGGVCSVGVPGLPGGYGSGCTLTNACGTTSAGVIGCSGGCEGAYAPLPPGYGTGCLSAPNTCGMRDSGTIDCSGSCNVPPPSDTLCTYSLHICENNCNSGLDRTGGTLSMFDISPSVTLRACYTDTSCTPGGYGDVTASTTWAETNAPQNAITLSGSTVSPNAMASSGTRSESINASYNAPYGGGLKTAATTAIVTKWCVSRCSVNAASHCSGTTYSESDSCGDAETCTGTRLCDFNWKEVAP